MKRIIIILLLLVSYVAPAQVWMQSEETVGLYVGIEYDNYNFYAVFDVAGMTKKLDHGTMINVAYTNQDYVSEYSFGLGEVVDMRYEVLQLPIQPTTLMDIKKFGAIEYLSIDGVVYRLNDKDRERLSDVAKLSY